MSDYVAVFIVGGVVGAGISLGFAGHLLLGGLLVGGVIGIAIGACVILSLTT